MEHLATFQSVLQTAPLRVFLEATKATAQTPAKESEEAESKDDQEGDFLRELNELMDLEDCCPWENGYQTREGPGGQPPESDNSEPEVETFGRRALRERAERAAAEAELARTGEPALPPAVVRPLTAEEKMRMNEQAKELRKKRERLAEKVPEETARLCTKVSHVLESLQPPSPPALRCGSEGVYAGKGGDIRAAVWMRAPTAPPLATARRVNLLLVVDTSGSMTQDMPVVRAVMTKLVRRAGPKDQLALITFDSRPVMKVNWTLCDSEGKQRINKVVDSLEASGRTAFRPTLNLVDRVLGEWGQRPVQVVFMSDGRPDDDQYHIHRHLCHRWPLLDVSLCTVAFGEKSDAALMAQMSLTGRGHYIFVPGMAMVGAAVGRLLAWAQHVAGECFLALRGLGGCKVVELEEGYGCVRLKDDGKSCLVLLGTLLAGQRRAVALRLSLPTRFRSQVLEDPNQPLAECFFIMRGLDGRLKVATCELRALQVPSLLVEGLLGFPLRVYLQDDDFEAFDKERQARLHGALCSGLGLPPSALVVDRVREGSVIVDAHVAVEPAQAMPLLRKLNLATLERHLHEEGFGELSIEVPGQLTAQRWLQWATANSVSARPSRTIPAMPDLEAGPLGVLDPRTASAVGRDLGLAGTRETHWRLQLQAGHLRTFAADPEACASLRDYETPQLRAGAQALDSRNGSPIKWLRIAPDGGDDKGFALRLAWEGELQGPHWLVTVEPEGPGCETLACFRHFDQNGDGVISPMELANVLRTLDPRTWTQSRVDALLKVVDTNADGLIQYGEFIQWLNAGDDSWDQLRQEFGIGCNAAERLTRMRVKIAKEMFCDFDGLAADVYRLTVKGADMQGKPGMYGQCWVCLGLRDLSPVVALLEAQEGEGALLQFSPISWVGWGTAAPAEPLQE